MIRENISLFLPRIDYLEGQFRQNNIVNDGIEESGNECWAESEAKVWKLLSDKLKITGIELEQVHWTGHSAGERTRPIVAKTLVGHRESKRFKEDYLCTH